MRIGRIVAPVALAMLTAFAADARANGFTKADAERAKASLSKGALVAEMTDAGGSIYIVREINTRDAADGKVRLEIQAEAMDLIAREGFDPAYGARPLKRAIQRLVQDPLALLLLESEFPEGTLLRALADDQENRIAFVEEGE